MENKEYVFSPSVGYATIEQINDKNIVLHDFILNEDHVVDLNAYNSLFSKRGLVTNYLIKLDIKDENRDQEKVKTFWKNIAYVEDVKPEPVEAEVLHEDVKEHVEHGYTSEDKTWEDKINSTTQSIKRGAKKVFDELESDVKDVAKEIKSWFKD